MTRRVLFFLAWPIRAAMALFLLLFIACLCPNVLEWELCKRDVWKMLRLWPEVR